MTSASSYCPSLYIWCARSSYSSELRNGVAIVCKPPAHEGTPIVQLRRTIVQWEKQRTSLIIARLNHLVAASEHNVAISPAREAFRSRRARFASSEVPFVKRVTAPSK